MAYRQVRVCVTVESYQPPIPVLKLKYDTDPKAWDVLVLEAVEEQLPQETEWHGRRTLTVRKRRGYLLNITGP